MGSSEWLGKGVFMVSVKYFLSENIQLGETEKSTGI